MFLAWGRDTREWGQEGKREWPLVSVAQWFSAGGVVPPQGTSGNARRHFWLSQLAGVGCYQHLVGRDLGRG